MFEWFKSLRSVKDAMLDPANTAGRAVKAIVRTLNPASQRIVVLILLGLAMVLGADIGIDYERSKVVGSSISQTHR